MSLHNQTIRRHGPLGALMDEYERAASELKNLLLSIEQGIFTQIADAQTQDPECRTMETVMNHVVRAGYTYANLIRKQFGDAWTARKPAYDVRTPEKANAELDIMLAYTLATLENKWDMTAEVAMRNQMKAAWGQVYDIEQLLEHAIVHILRHRRQIEGFLSALTTR